MTPFLSQVASHYYREGLDGLFFVFPSRRAEVFFRKYLAQEVKGAARPVLCPPCATVDDFLWKAAGARKADRVRLLLVLYECYAKLFRTLNRCEPEPLDDSLLGFIGLLPEPMSGPAFCQLVKERFSLRVLRCSAPVETVWRVATSCGAGSSFAEKAFRLGRKRKAFSDRLSGSWFFRRLFFRQFLLFLFLFFPNFIHDRENDSEDQSADGDAADDDKICLHVFSAFQCLFLPAPLSLRSSQQQ